MSDFEPLNGILRVFFILKSLDAGAKILDSKLSKVFK
jgi:hypothetical protein